jgi:hypothetical protein
MQEKERPTRFDDPGNALDGSRMVIGATEALTTDEPSSDDVIEAVVHGLNRLCRQATFEFTLAVGQMVIDNVYGGDLNLWRSRDPTKIISLRKLARHPRLPMSPTALYRSIAIYELCERFDVKCWHHVSTSHLRLVLPLANEEQVRLLRMTEANMWPVRRLDQEIKALLEHKASRGGPRRRSRLSQAMARVGKSIDTLERYLDPSPHDPEPSPDSLRDAIACLRRAVEVCATLERRLSDRVDPRHAGLATTHDESVADSSR